MAFDSETWRSESGLHYLSIALRNKIINIDRARDGTPDRERAMWDKRIEACFSGVVLCEQAALESWIAAALRTHDISIRKAKGESHWITRWRLGLPALAARLQRPAVELEPAELDDMNRLSTIRNLIAHGDEVARNRALKKLGQSFREQAGWVVDVAQRLFEKGEAAVWGPTPHVPWPSLLDDWTVPDEYLSEQNEQSEFGV